MRAVVAVAAAEVTAEAGRGCSGGHRRAGQRARPPPGVTEAKVPAMLLVERSAAAETRPRAVASEVVSVASEVVSVVTAAITTWPQDCTTSDQD